MSMATMLKKTEQCLKSLFLNATADNMHTYENLNEIRKQKYMHTVND